MTRYYWQAGKPKKSRPSEGQSTKVGPQAFTRPFTLLQEYNYIDWEPRVQKKLTKFQLGFWATSVGATAVCLASPSLALMPFAMHYIGHSSRPKRKNRVPRRRFSSTVPSNPNNILSVVLLRKFGLNLDKARYEHPVGLQQLNYNN